MTSRSVSETPDVPDGIVRVTPGDRSGMYLVQIGRTARVKTFYLSDTEARQLIEELGRVLPQEGRIHAAH